MIVLAPDAAHHMTARLTTPFARGAALLDLELAAEDSEPPETVAAIEPYNFSVYRARFDAVPTPAYVLTAREDLPDGARVEVDITEEGADEVVVVDVPSGTLRGASFRIGLVDVVPPDGRLVRLRLADPATGASAADAWQVTALLGNIAKLLWAVGVERDTLRRHMELVRTQTRVEQATGHSLDWIGSDLMVPRFPPRPHTFDPDTVALYHLDDRADAEEAEVTAVEDFMVRYGGTGHAGDNIGELAESGAVGRFGRAFAFRRDGAFLRIPAHTDFDLPADRDATIELFVRPDRELMSGEVISRDADPDDSSVPGWTLAIGDFGRGYARALRATVKNGVAERTLFLDATLPTDRFTHIALVIDRAATSLRLVVDGTVHARTELEGLGALTAADPIVIGGRSGAFFRGVVDEVRYSRVARTDFAPVLGEGDEGYRTRLRLFSSWILPTRAGLQEALNLAVGSVGGDPEPVVVDDADGARITASRTFRIAPTSVDLGASIDSFGNQPGREAEAAGTTSDEPAFQPDVLVRHNTAGVTYAPGAVDSPADPRRMQVATAEVLDKLIGNLAETGPPGSLVVLSGYDPDAGDLRSVGRAVVLQHTDTTIGRLAAMAHDAGFTYVAHLTGPSRVYASVAPNEYFAIEKSGGSAAPIGPFDLTVGETLDLMVRPPLTGAEAVRWRLIRCGFGAADFASPDDGVAATITATAPGSLWVKVSVTRGTRTLTGTLRIGIAPASLDDGRAIGPDGAPDAPESVAGEPDALFDPVYLVGHNDPSARYPGGLESRRMQTAVAATLTRLLDLVEEEAVTGQVRLLEGFDPDADDLGAVGRGLAFDHATLDPSRLGALAHIAGFTHVRRAGDRIVVRHEAAGLVTIEGPERLDLGTTNTFVLAPQSAPSGLANGEGSIFVANRGTDSVTELDAATGAVGRTLKTGLGPVAVALSTDGQRLFTADAGIDRVTTLDLATETVITTTEMKPEPVALAVHPNEPRLFVVCRSGQAVVQMDTQTGDAADAVELPAGSSAVVALEDGDRLWVAGGEAQSIEVFTTAPLGPTGSIALGDEPADLAANPDGDIAYVTLPKSGAVVVLDVATESVTATVVIGGTPDRICVAPDGQVYVSNPAAGRVHVLSADGVEVDAIVDHRAVTGMVAGTNPDTGEPSVFVSHGVNGDIARVDPAVSTATYAEQWLLGTGLGERVIWTTSGQGPARAEAAGTTGPIADVAGITAGVVTLQAALERDLGTAAYTFEIHLKDDLETADAILRKDQYDRLMNVLNAFRPIGVEITIRRIRERVVEVRDGLMSALPEYTFPRYRVRGPALGRPGRPVPQ